MDLLDLEQSCRAGKSSPWLGEVLAGWFPSVPQQCFHSHAHHASYRVISCNSESWKNLLMAWLCWCVSTALWFMAILEGC